MTRNLTLIDADLPVTGGGKTMTNDRRRDAIPFSLNGLCK